MKQKTTSRAYNRLFTLALFAFLAMGACKSKKKVVEQAPPPPPVEKVEEAPVAPPAPSAEEVAVEKLENLFQSVTNASSVPVANRMIDDSMSMFSNQNTPVLIVIHEERGIKDYDEPTTINKYLHYLKDTKKNLNFVSDVRLDGNGRVSEIELRRK
ncbi:hypothetical protein A3SI_17749 [Nitritalea halalkaliphila LW7]|uniref:Nucleoid-structuring protein H-NS n=1 Tax=Nitritalea halalkaliphila LW7 TaxID=1189621 RepID=I5BVM9_9BACT|nr:hypothetical protein [Nitritalea halalkaliphila]EIM73631.1 hypothetical protein A3SI_17749 [Nitritalea halalkaliphila LW7]